MSSIVSVLGHRQVGKTTLIEQIAKDYATLDDGATLDLAEADPAAFLYGKDVPFAIDECQLCPPLFPALKERVRKNKDRGQFILSGSVRFSGVEEIKESLTGRTIDLELVPLCISEAHRLPLSKIEELFSSPNILRKLADRQIYKDHDWRKLLLSYLETGGLPGISFLRNDGGRTRLFRTHLRTVLDRDLRIVTKTRLDLTTLRNLLGEIALLQGEALEYEDLGRKTGIAKNTLKRLLYGLGVIYLVRLIPIEGDYKGFVPFLEDQGIATFLQNEKGMPTLSQTASFRVPDLTRGLYAQLLCQTGYSVDRTYSIFQYRTRGGAFIPLAVREKDKVIGFTLSSTHTPTPSHLKSARSFLKRYANGRVYLLTCGETFRQHDDRIIEAPFGTML